MQNMSLDPKRRFALSGSSDEDPYSLTSGNGSSGSSARFKQTAQQLLLGPDKTPLLNKKERDFFVPQNWSATQVQLQMKVERRFTKISQSRRRHLL